MKKLCVYNRDWIFILIFLSLFHDGCINQKKQPVIVPKNMGLKIFLDSTDLYIELSFNGMFFHVENPSDDNVLLTFNSEQNTTSRKSLLLITPFQDTIPIWYRIPNQHYYIFPPRTTTSFAGHFERKKIFEKLHLRPKGTTGLDFFKEIITKSRIIYIPDENKALIKGDKDLDTIYSPESVLTVNNSNNKFVWHGDTYTGKLHWELMSEK